MLKIYNTKTRTKETFKPIITNTVSLYVCGMTVYDLCHIGHARVMVFFDTAVKYFKHLGFSVNYVRNITDIDDKIINRANQNNENFIDLVARFIKEMHQDSNALNITSPNMEPRATNSMAEIITMIKLLVNKKVAYVIDGDVYFSVKDFKQYGKLSGKNIDDLLMGARVEVNNKKHAGVDFALWKSAKPNEPSWESPWGKGRPGWHIECSAMSQKYLGDRFDIHGGGMDLIFPHHENEIAQSEACVGHTHVNTWMHIGFVRIDDEKMSKSLGNFFTIREVLKNYPAEIIRLFLLSSHYRSPLNYSDDNLNNASSALTRLYKSLLDINLSDGEINADWQAKFDTKMNDDFNTPGALSILFELAREINRLKSFDNPDFKLIKNLSFTLKNLANILGLLTNSAKDFCKSIEPKGKNDTKIERLIIERNQARIDKNWAKSDEIRDKLQKMNISIEDSKNGTKWYRH